jgi:acyl-coenzyme A thioesterase PaaI-like protein
MFKHSFKKGQGRMKLLSKMNHYENLKKLWNKLSTTSMGKTAFSRMVGFIIPYTGTIKAQVLEFQEGFVKVEMKDRHKIRNHLNSVHALALGNLGEFTTGLALVACMPPKSQMILAHLSIEYQKKARGTLTSEARLTKEALSLANSTQKIQALIRDESMETVCTVEATWKLRALK